MAHELLHQPSKEAFQCPGEIGCVDMNHEVRNSNVNANPTSGTKSDLLRELGNETGMARRQELLKAIWRLDRQAVRPVSPSTAGPPAAATAKPEPEADRSQPSSVQIPDRRPNARTNSPIANATPQNAHNRSLGIVNDKQTLAALNQLYAIEKFSLANYLRYAKPWVSRADQCLAEAIRHIGDRQLEFVERVGTLIIERRGHVQGDSFPFRFTAYNDLSVAYLAPRVMDDQEQIVRQVRAIANQLRADAAACDLANEILGAEQAHLNNLRELLDRPNSDTCHQSTVAGLGEKRCQNAAPNVATAA